MKSRKQYEDIIQKAITMMLPKFPLENIRPAFQKINSKTGKVVTEEGLPVSVQPFTNGSDYIYFNIVFDTENNEPYVYEDSSVDIIRNFNVVITCYGENSSGIALLIKSLIRTQYILSYLNENGFFLLNERGINQLNEILNYEYWERRDITFTFNERVDIKVPNKDINVSTNIDNSKISIGGVK